MTTLPKFTPGEWTRNEWGTATNVIYIGTNGTPRVAAIPLRDVSRNEQMANAALVSAAPDMFHALTECVAVLKALGMFVENLDLSVKDLSCYIKAEAALDKATNLNYAPNEEDERAVINLNDESTQKRLAAQWGFNTETKEKK